MSADLLRRAAAEMRKWAESATPGRWKLWGMTVMADQDGTSNYDTAVSVAQTYYRDEHNKPRTFDAEHIRGMQPAVALAMADLLGIVAEQWSNDTSCYFPIGPDEACGDCGDCDQRWLQDRAITTARAYLGEPA